MKKNSALWLIRKPSKFANAVGFDKLGELHNGWIRDMFSAKEDKTLQAHRNAFKTTCVAIALVMLIILKPNDRTLFLRKTDDDIKEIIAQVKKILEHPLTRQLVREIHNIELELTTDNATEISTNLCTDTRGSSQLVGMGIKASLTGKHYDHIFTDDIVTLKDRISKADRDATKTAYQELQNLKTDKGRIYNTGTPWHQDDAFTLMPEPERWDCYSTGIMSDEAIQEKKDTMTASRFAVNYELKHIASENIIFANAQIGEDAQLITNGKMHIDAGYDGEDWTAVSIINRISGKYYVLGKCWTKHVIDCYDDIIKLYRQHLCGRVYLEKNADKGMVARDLKAFGLRTKPYHESMNKYIKITTYLKATWPNVYFVSGTDDDFVQQILDYNENAEHDDCPDTVASNIREVYFKKDKEGYIDPIIADLKGVMG